MNFSFPGSVLTNVYASTASLLQASVRKPEPGDKKAGACVDAEIAGRAKGSDRLEYSVAVSVREYMQLSLFDLFFTRRASSATAAGRRELVLSDDQRLQQRWCQIRRKWFPLRPDLDSYDVRWSSRPQKRTLASCNVEHRRVRVARELLPTEYERWLEPLLYHEMCHAYLGLSVFSETERSRWHGKEFRALERRHPEMRSFDAWVKSGGWARAVRSDRARRSRARLLRA